MYLYLSTKVELRKIGALEVVKNNCECDNRSEWVVDNKSQNLSLRSGSEASISRSLSPRSPLDVQRADNSFEMKESIVSSPIPVPSKEPPKESPMLAPLALQEDIDLHI